MNTNTMHVTLTHELRCHMRLGEKRKKRIYYRTSRTNTHHSLTIEKRHFSIHVEMHRRSISYGFLSTHGYKPHENAENSTNQHGLMMVSGSLFLIHNWRFNIATVNQSNRLVRSLIAPFDHLNEICSTLEATWSFPVHFAFVYVCHASCSSIDGMDRNLYGRIEIRKNFLLSLSHNSHFISSCWLLTLRFLKIGCTLLVWI